jgi:hypothetical protein
MLADPRTWFSFRWDRNLSLDVDARPLPMHRQMQPCALSKSCYEDMDLLVLPWSQLTTSVFIIVDISHLG